MCQTLDKKDPLTPYFVVCASIKLTKEYTQLELVESNDKIANIVAQLQTQWKDSTFQAYIHVVWIAFVKSNPSFFAEMTITLKSDPSDFTSAMNRHGILFISPIVARVENVKTFHSEFVTLLRDVIPDIDNNLLNLSIDSESCNLISLLKMIII